jgi:cytochrome c oxidase assembly factor CtaG/putative copper export protein
MMRRPLTVAIAFVAPLTAVVIVLLVNGEPASLPGLPGPGRIVTVGLPFVQAVRDVGAVVAVGALVVLATCLAPRPDAAAELTAPQVRARTVVLTGLSAWSVGNLALLVLAYSDSSGRAIGSMGFWSEARFFAFNFEQGQYLVAGFCFSAVVLFFATFTRHQPGWLYLALLALIGLWPLALSGHGATAINHDTVVDLQFAHWVGVGVWAGGLATLIVIRPVLGHDLAIVARRFSALAGWSLVAVALSGGWGALLRLDSVGDLASRYGLLLGLKTGAIAVLAIAGWWHRRRLLDQVAAGSERAFARLLVAEGVVIAAAIGIAVALSRTPAPVSTPPLDTTTDALGYPLPSALDGAAWFIQWRPDAIWSVAAVLAVGWYVRAAHSLRGRGDTWSPRRQAAWLVGWALMVWATNGAPGVYGRVLFSAHMVQHMTIATAVPVFLVLGAPVTLALRTLRRRADGSLGPREALQVVVHSPLVRLFGHPVVAGTLFIASLVAFYYSSLFELALSSHTAHVLMTVHFLVAGYLFASCLVGIDPGTRQPAFPLRVLMVMVTFGLHSLFSVSLMAKTDVLAAAWYESIERPWGRSLLDDQYLGASLGWALGDYPLAVLAGVLVSLWFTADRRESRRFDRSEERTGDGELASYNEYLSRLSESAERRD